MVNQLQLFIAAPFCWIDGLRVGLLLFSLEALSAVRFYLSTAFLGSCPTNLMEGRRRGGEGSSASIIAGPHNMVCIAAAPVSIFSNHKHLYLHLGFTNIIFITLCLRN